MHGVRVPFYIIIAQRFLKVAHFISPLILYSVIQNEINKIKSRSMQVIYMKNLMQHLL